MATKRNVRLWRFNRVTGLWVVERACEPGTGKDWLAVFRKDQPAETFILALRRPSKAPQVNR